MKRSDLIYSYPEELVALSPVKPSRVMWVDPAANEPNEITLQQLTERIPEGDVLVINNTQVLKRRVFAESVVNTSTVEILFLEKTDSVGTGWLVLFPAKPYKIGDEFRLPNGRIVKLVEKGLPQVVQSDSEITESEFQKIAELPLPPYIQKARHERHNRSEDSSWYQTAWASTPGSFAAPTASLHFTNEDIERLRKRGVQVLEITLHVGLGTFLPVKVEDLNEHKMHSEVYTVPDQVWKAVQKAQIEKRGIWAMGTTVTRTLETVARTGKLNGESDLFLKPGSEFLVINRLLTNFHQPESTLLALVAAFSSLEKVKSSYAWAIAKKFRLFSYGDLSVWLRPIK